MIDIGYVLPDAEGECPMNKLSNIRSFHPEAAVVAGPALCRLMVADSGTQTGWTSALAARHMR